MKDERVDKSCKSISFKRIVFPSGEGFSLPSKCISHEGATWPTVSQAREIHKRRQVGRQASEQAASKSVHVPRIDPFDTKWALRALYGRFLHTYLPTLETPNTYRHRISDERTLPVPSWEISFSLSLSLSRSPLHACMWARLVFFQSSPWSLRRTIGSRNFETGIVASRRLFTNRRASFRATPSNVSTECLDRNLDDIRPRNLQIARCESSEYCE